MDEPRIKTAPTPCPPGWGWGYAAERYDAMGEPEKAAHAREMAERSRKAGRSLVEGEPVREVKVNAKGQLELW